MNPLGYSFSWLKSSHNDKLKDITGWCYSYPTRDTILDIKETAKTLLDMRPDLDQQIAMDVAISLVEKRVCCDLTAFREFLSIAKIDKNGDTQIPSYKIMDCDCKEE